MIQNKSPSVGEDLLKDATVVVSPGLGIFDPIIQEGFVVPTVGIATQWYRFFHQRGAQGLCNDNLEELVQLRYWMGKKLSEKVSKEQNDSSPLWASLMAADLLNTAVVDRCDQPPRSWPYFGRR